MSRTATDVGPAGRFPGRSPQPAIDPAWQPWLDLLGIALGTTGDPAWSGIVVLADHRDAGAPLLDGASLRLDRDRVNALARELAVRAGFVAVEAIDGREIIRASVMRDAEALGRIAELLAVPLDAVAVVGQLAALPVLHGCVPLLEDRTQRVWQRGYCPVCGAWPTLAELRGIERDRRLRCGCCGADWPLPVLHCVFCDEIDHRKLGSLAPDSDEQQVRVETCETCHGYLKSVTTLGALALDALALRDLATVSLDLAAQELGYNRPSPTGFPLHVSLLS